MIERIFVREICCIEQFDIFAYSNSVHNTGHQSILNLHSIEMIEL